MSQVQEIFNATAKVSLPIPQNPASIHNTHIPQNTQNDIAFHFLLTLSLSHLFFLTLEQSVNFLNFLFCHFVYIHLTFLRMGCQVCSRQKQTPCAVIVKLKRCIFSFTSIRISAALMMNHSFPWQVTRNLLRCCLPRVRWMPLVPGIAPCFSGPSSILHLLRFVRSPIYIYIFTSIERVKDSRKSGN